MSDTDALKILVTNDDGIHAPGLKSLEAIAAVLSDDVWVVAPETEQSGASHSLTLAHPLRLRKLDDRRFAVEGTPTDCVLMGLKNIMPEQPDLILSGVNRGQNLCEDVTYSGTVAAAMEGTALGVRAIALSQSYGIAGRDTLKWQTTEHHGAQLVRRLVAADWGPGVLININFPDCEPEDVDGVEITVQGQRDQNLITLDERVDARGRAYYWIGFERKRSNPGPGTDLRAVYDNKISVTPLHMDLTQNQAIPTLQRLFDDGGWEGVGGGRRLP